MNIFFITNFFLSLISFGFITYNLLKNQAYEEVPDQNINNEKLSVQSEKICSDIFSNETYVDYIFTSIKKHLDIPTSNYCTYRTEPRNKTIENLLDRIEKYCCNSDKNKTLDFFQDKPSLRFSKIDDYKNQKEEELNCDKKYIQDLKESLPKNILRMNTLKFAIKMQAFDLTKACLKAFIFHSKNCFNPEYKNIIEDCFFIPLANREGYCYTNTMSEKDIYENVKLFNTNSRAKNVIKTKTNFFKEMGKRCTYFQDLNPLINLNKRVVYFKNKNVENSFTLKYYYRAYIDFCKKIKNYEQNDDSNENIKFIKDLKRSSDVFNINFGTFTDEMNNILLNYYNITERGKFLTANENYENRYLPTNYDHYKKNAIISNLNNFNQWLTRFSKKD